MNYIATIRIMNTATLKIIGPFYRLSILGAVTVGTYRAVHAGGAHYHKPYISTHDPSLAPRTDSIMRPWTSGITSPLQIMGTLMQLRKVNIRKWK